MRFFRAILALWMLVASPVWASTFTVTNTLNAGTNSFRWAIDQVNLTPGPHRIAFNIPAPGIQTIHLLTDVASISNTVAIDGSTQPGYNQNGGGPLIEIAGFPAANSLLLKTTATHSSVKAITFNRWGDAALNISADACSLSGCWFGLNNTGTAADSEGYGVYVFGKHCLIGGHAPATRNVFGGMGSGIMILSPAADDTVCGNYVGTDVTGSVGIPMTVDCIEISNAKRIVIGGPGAYDGNLISASAQAGVEVYSNPPVTNGDGVRFYRNFIGTDASGQRAIPNLGDGIRLDQPYNIIGDIGMGNVISGNHQSGIYIDGPQNSHDNYIAGNKIGVSADGTIPVGNFYEGIYIDTSDNNFIGGSLADGSGNLIGGNQDGIYVTGTNNIIQGNAIGTSFNGALDLGHRQVGLSLYGDNTTVGGLGNLGNIIAKNQYGGIRVHSLENPIRANSIFDNHQELGIDLLDATPFGVTPNDSLDGDSGGNYLQNFPVITAVSRVGAQVRLQGRYSSEPNSSYTLDFYSNRQCNALGNGEGESWLGAVGVSTNASGLGTFDVSYNLIAVVGNIFTCTATDFIGDTSEFSPCAPLASLTAADAGPPRFGFEAPLPSPARRSTSLTFTLVEPSRVSLVAYDVSGRVAAHLVEDRLDAGPHTFAWNVARTPAGVYFCRLRAETESGAAETVTRSVIVIH